MRNVSNGTIFSLTWRNDMKTSFKPPRNKKPGDVESQKETDGPASAERTSEPRPAGEPSSENPSGEEVIATWRKPVTNQDEQEKITNSNDDIPVADK